MLTAASSAREMASVARRSRRLLKTAVAGSYCFSLRTRVQAPVAIMLLRGELTLASAVPLQGHFAFVVVVVVVVPHVLAREQAREAAAKERSASHTLHQCSKHVRE